MGVAIDYIAKWSEVAAIPDKSPCERSFHAGHYRQAWLPTNVVSDTGGELFGKLDKLLQKCKTDHRFASADHPQANGLVEHFSGTCCSALRKCAENSPADSDELIQQCCLATGQHCNPLPGFHLIPCCMPGTLNYQ